MKQELAVPIIAIFLILATQYVNSFSVVLAKSIKSNDKPTLSECKGAIGHTGIAQTFIAACLLYYPDVFKSEGGTLFPTDSSSEGVEPFKNKK
jgi:hypothetical protein